MLATLDRSTAPADPMLAIDESHPDAENRQEVELVAALRRGDERAFAQLVDKYHGTMVRIARTFTPSQEVAEEVAQETWLAALNGLVRFEGRSTFKTWLFRILTNRAKTRGEREKRQIAFSMLGSGGGETEEDGEMDWLLDVDHNESPADGAANPRRWRDTPEERTVAKELRRHIQVAIEALPPQQRQVITLRDVEGWSAEEVCVALKISDANQRVLLHRARGKVRQALAPYLDEPDHDDVNGFDGSSTPHRPTPNARTAGARRATESSLSVRELAELAAGFSAKSRPASVRPITPVYRSSSQVVYSSW